MSRYSIWTTLTLLAAAFAFTCDGGFELGGTEAASVPDRFRPRRDG